MREIILTKGNVALVDDEDFEELSKYVWRDSSGYASRVTSRKTGKRKTIMMHRHILGLDRLKDLEVDHINGNRSDNRKCNLRIVSRKQNSLNVPARSSNSCFGYKGVSFDKRNSKYSARIVMDGKKIWLGYFESANDAARMYNFWAKDIFGEYARLNVIKEETE